MKVVIEKYVADVEETRIPWLEISGVKKKTDDLDRIKPRFLCARWHIRFTKSRIQFPGEREEREHFFLRVTSCHSTVLEKKNLYTSVFYFTYTFFFLKIFCRDQIEYTSTGSRKLEKDEILFLYLFYFQFYWTIWVILVFLKTTCWWFSL